jgi:long-chain acyl-CoA synthetase
MSTKYLPDLLAQAASDAPDAEALVYRSVRMTYAELLQATERCARSLVAAGVNAGAPVAVVAGNHPGFAVGLLAALRAGALAVPINPQFRKRELEMLLADTGVMAILADPERLELAREAAGVVPAAVLLTLDEAGRMVPADDASGATLPAALDADAPAICQYSTGTTGRPKRVVRSHRQFLDEIQALHSRLATTSDEVFLGSIPLFHSHGMCNCLWAAIRCRGRLVLTGGFYARAILNLIETEGVSIWPTVPFMVRILTEMPGPKRRPLDSLRLVFSAGAPLDPDVALRFGQRYGIGVRQLYGCTEMGAICINDDGDLPATLDSVGKALPGSEFIVVDDQDRPVPTGQAGAIAVSGPGLASGYDWADDKARGNFRAGRFFPGDLGSIDDDGRLRLAGRTQLFINVGGSKVDPEEVERVLASHADVADVAVVRAPHPYYGETVKAVLVPKEGVAIDDKELRRHCRESLADYKVPKTLVVRDSIPRSATGKVLRKYLEDEELEG